MKIKKLLASSLAAMIAVSAMAISTSAADSYNAYFAIQTGKYTFRNAFDEPSYGKGVKSDEGWEYFSTLTGWVENKATDMGGDFTDVKIDKDGTYKVGLSGDFNFEGEETFNMIFVSTDIPFNSGVTISDVKISFDGNVKKTYDEAIIDEENDPAYIKIFALNEYNSDMKGEVPYTIPSKSIEIEFTVSGLGSGAADTDAPADTDKDSDDKGGKDNAGTGVGDVAAIAAVTLLAGAAVVISRKRK